MNKKMIYKDIISAISSFKLSHEHRNSLDGGKKIDLCSCSKGGVGRNFPTEKQGS